MNEKTQDMSSLLSHKPTLEMVFAHPSFLDEVAYQNEQLFEFLSSQENVGKLLDLVFQSHHEGASEKLAHEAFFAFKSIAECQPRLTEAILKEQTSFKKIFSLIKDNKDQNLTARGYFQSIMKNFLSDQNPQLLAFVKALKESPEHYIFPLVKNLNKANAEIIKDILSSSNEKLHKLQLCIFEFLLFYFLNEQFGQEDV